jgi:ABC-type glycerol-3-phosphate transport system substrate-binding protein
MSYKRISRRTFLKGSAALAAATLSPWSSGQPFSVFASPSTQLSGTLRILQWSHFVPRYDTWFDEFAVAWGNEVGVEVIVDHIGLGDLPAAAAAELNAGEGHDLIEFLSPPSAFEKSLLDLRDVNEEAENRFGEQVAFAKRSTYNPFTDFYYGFCHGWVPDPGNYRLSLWEAVDKPEGPATWQDLVDYGGQIFAEQGVQLGIGMSNELDSNMAGRALMWSYGASIQDENGQVVINSPETIAAVEFMADLYNAAMTPEVFGWVPASNNQLLLAGQASYILNSISAYRTAQADVPEVAADVLFTPAMTGPDGAGVASAHVIPIYFVPQHAENVDAAKEFMLHLTANYNDAVFNAELYNFPAFADTAPDLLAEGGWLDEDPFESEPLDKLQSLRDAVEWTTNIGHPGPANPAIGEVFATFVIPTMFAQVARGEKNPEEAVEEAEEQVVAIFDNWRDEGLIE